jgi:ABC-type ATPase involved in cell division
LVQHEKFRGEQHRAALARALVNHPTLLLTGEPIGNLGSAAGESIVVLFRKIQRSLGITIILARTIVFRHRVA